MLPIPPFLLSLVPLVLGAVKRAFFSKWTGTGLGVALGLVGVVLAGWTIWRIVSSDDPPQTYTARQSAAACDQALLAAENDALKEDIRRLAARLADRGAAFAELTDKLQALETEQDDARAQTSVDPHRIVVPADDKWLQARARRTGAARAEGATGR